MHHFALSIQVWYRQNYRELPWRSTKEPYKIWLSEIIMQQTRVDQGLNYYNEILKAYPTVESLALANEQEILRLWQGLGYYSRARNMHFAAQQVVNDFDGVFPDNYVDIKSLKGVGDYTASAIASFAYDLPYPVVDGNVFRVLSRYFNDPTPIDTSDGVKVFKAYAEGVLNKEDPAEFNQAIMEMGALVCRPKNPDCENCPLNTTCLAYNEGDPLSLPVKVKKVKVSRRYFHYFLHPSTGIQLEQRKGKGIWQNMYHFPVLEAENRLNKKEVEEMLRSKYGVKLIRKIFSEKHILSHQHIDATFWLIENKLKGEEFISTDLTGIDAFPLPRLIERFIEKYTDLFS